ncbi:carboxypeptidase-like regulatory domain-containing protein (plasmid) [Burkholderia sp. FERM BP-3421]|uniref:carboxypeptidase-like regulatory domain-containing protein n=1 Tax=Burkholderia sp. FERM BP-3421 TaxID=1494466 RepID=UPI00235FD214|nr:carboxypeptidase-like regulatory domain-containing protein [Burkholderia sp. FERM BP-3421]WDD90381.1 carboxypeptidase-like regulatory domain-containing protein [Burkholderia sp. FERM BP-3421]
MKTFSSPMLALLLGALCVGTAPVAADDDLPPLHRTEQVSYLSGGVGLDQSAAIKRAMHDYALALTFVRRARSGNEYLSGVLVTITDMKGNTVLNTPSDGPFMLADLRNGRYAVDASYNGRSERYIVDISASRHARHMFVWSM